MGRARVVVIGAGVRGLACARALRGKGVGVLLLDRNNYHLFTPLLYQVASSLLNPSDIARPVRSIFGGAKNVRFRQAEVAGVGDFARKVVRTAEASEVPYDYLVIAAGSRTNYFGMADVETRALGLKDLPEALELRNRVLQSLEEATLKDAAEAEPWLTFVVAGGGPTGVEYAGALSELVRLVLPKEYPGSAGRRIRIVLVEGADRVLPPFPRLGEAARRALEGKGVEARTGVRVTAFAPGEVRLSDGSTVAAQTLVWAAGVRPAELAAAVDAPRSRSGRLEVDDELRLRGHDDVFAIGDIASVAHQGGEVPMLSAPAMQEGRAAAANILRAMRGSRLQPFHYRDKGTMATIGKNAAVAKLGPLKLTGFLGWATWLVVHLYYIIGFRNRLVVLSGWAWNYLRSDRPVRIITRARESKG